MSCIYLLNLRVHLPVQLSTRKKAIMAFSGLVYEDDAVCHLIPVSAAHSHNLCWCKASIKSCQVDWLACGTSSATATH